MEQNKLDEFMATKVMEWHTGFGDFTDNDSLWWVDADEDIIILKTNWQPTTDPGQAMWCMNKFSKTGVEAWAIIGNKYRKPERFEIVINDFDMANTEEFDDIPLAICQAIYKAVKGA